MNRSRLAGIVSSAALVIVAVVLGILGSGDRSDGMAGAPSGFVSVKDLTRLEGTFGHPIYWVGPRPGKALEVTREADGSVYLRYLPKGIEAGDHQGLYLTVGTYPVADAAAALARTAANEDVSLRRLQRGAVLLLDPASPASAYVAIPESDVQIEVYDPEPGRAEKIVEAGALRPVG